MEMESAESNIQKNQHWAVWAGRAWALPNTLLGMMIGLAGRNRWVWQAGTLEVRLGRGPVLGVCRRLGISAFTLGDCVVYAVEPCRNLRAHEGRHSWQYYWLGPLFLPVYFGLLGIYGYWNHPLERDARKWEERVCGCLYVGGVAGGREPDSGV